MDAVYYGLTAAAVVLLVWYYIVYYQAERPRAGTLEWIDRYEKKPCVLSSCGKALHWSDALWALLPAAIAVLAGLLMQNWEELYSGTLGVLLKIPYADGTIYLSGEVLCAALAAAAIYLLGKALTGRVFAALAGALLYAVRPGFECYSFCLAGGMLLMWLWAGSPARGVKAWVLLLGGSMLLGAGMFSLAMPPVLVSFVTTLLFVCIQRAREEQRGGWYALLQIAAALVFAAVGFFCVAIVYGEGESIFAAPGDWLLSVFAEQSAVLIEWLTAPLLLDRLLRLPLLLSGVVPLFLRWYDGNSGDALFLLLWALPAAVFFAVLPAVLPMVTAGLVCAYLTGRLMDRGRPVAAAFGALGAIAVYGLQDLIWEFFYLSSQF